MKVKNSNIFLFPLLALFFTLTACTSVKPVAMPEYHERIEYRDRWRIDSVFDSVYVYIKGDTIHHTRLQIQKQIILRNDTVIVRDTVPQMVEVIVEKKTPYKMPWYIKTVFYFGILSMTYTASRIIYKLWIKPKFRL